MLHCCDKTEVSKSASSSDLVFVCFPVDISVANKCAVHDCLRAGKVAEAQEPASGD